MVAGYHNRRLLHEYMLAEVGIDHTFRSNFRIGSIAERLNAGEEPPTTVEDWRM